MFKSKLLPPWTVADVEVVEEEDYAFTAVVGDEEA